MSIASADVFAAALYGSAIGCTVSWVLLFVGFSIQDLVGTWWRRRKQKRERWL